MPEYFLRKLKKFQIGVIAVVVVVMTASYKIRCSPLIRNGEGIRERKRKGIKVGLGKNRLY